MNDWIFNSIFGTDEPTLTRSVPAVPIIDDPPMTVVGAQRSQALERLIELAEREATIKAIFGEAGDEIVALMKNSALQPVPQVRSSQENPVLKFHRDLEPLVADFRDRLYPYSTHVPVELFERVVNSMANCLADTVAAF